MNTRALLASLTLALFSTAFPLQSTHAQDCTNPDGSVGEIVYNADYALFQGCTATGWHGFHATECLDGDCGCGVSPAPGDRCADGTIYAGTSPDGGVAMYTTPIDAPETYTWNDGSPNYATVMEYCSDVTPGTASSCQTGESNTTLLAALHSSGSPAPYKAAEYCAGLDAHGHNDWYLPAQDELDVLQKHHEDIGGFDTSGTTGSYYWSSSQHSHTRARWQFIIDGTQARSYQDTAGLRSGPGCLDRLAALLRWIPVAVCHAASA
ncbi:MAG: DUF1566 domain-containing protein [Alphaproteobacteria bacterium]|nr:DUF1566 domain-containing protein [Alphaproteobacteria bacterium]